MKLYIRLIIYYKYNPSSSKITKEKWCILVTNVKFNDRYYYAYVTQEVYNKYKNDPKHKDSWNIYNCTKL